MSILDDPNIVAKLGLLVAIIAAILAIFVPWVIHRRESEIRRLEYDIDSSENLIPSDPDIRGKMVVTVDGIQVKRLYAHSVRVMNTGTLAVEPNQYHDQLTLSLSHDSEAQIVGFTVSEIWPSEMDVKPISAANNISLPNLLLNSGDGYTVTLLTTSEETPTVKGRIINGELTRFRNAKEPFTAQQRLTLTALTTLSICPYVALTVFKADTGGIIMVAAFLGAVFFIWAIRLYFNYSFQRNTRRWGRMPRRAIREIMEMHD